MEVRPKLLTSPAGPSSKYNICIFLGRTDSAPRKVEDGARHNFSPVCPRYAQGLRLVFWSIIWARKTLGCFDWMKTENRECFIATSWDVPGSKHTYKQYLVLYNYKPFTSHLLTSCNIRVDDPPTYIASVAFVMGAVFGTKGKGRQLARDMEGAVVCFEFSFYTAGGPRIQL